MSALRVCLLTPAFPPEVGGQELHLYELSESLIDQGALVTVLTRRPERNLPHRQNMGAVPVRRLSPVGSTRGKGWKAVLPTILLLANATWRLLRDRHRYDVVLVSGFNILPIAAVLAGRLTGKRCVVRPESPLELTHAVAPESLHSMGFSRRSLPVRWFGIFRGYVARRVDRYIAISSQIQRQLIESGVDPARVEVIPNGIDTQRFSPVTRERKLALREELGLPRDGDLSIYTGRLAHSKGVMMLARIWADIMGAYPRAHWVIVGSGHGSTDDCEEELRAFVAEHGLSDRVTFAGNVANVHQFLQASDLFVFPSDSEGFGLSILEAMAVGLPMVSTRVGVASDVAVTADAGLIVPPRDATQFKASLIRLLQEQSLREGLAARAHSAVRERYSMGAVSKRHIEVMSGTFLAQP